MIRRIMRAFLSTTLAGIVLLGLAAGPTYAATSSSSSVGGSGLKVSPVTTSLVIKPGQGQTIALTVQNVTSSPMSLQALVNDFTASGDESGAPALLLDGKYAPTHSLKHFVAPIDNLTLQPGESKNVPVTISIPPNASGGGYYGAVRFAPTVASGGGTVTLSASVGSLILVRVPGKYKEAVQLMSLDVRHGASGSAHTVFTTNKNLVAMARFQNTGDVQEQPFGKILLQQGNKVLATYEVNNATPLGNVLPGSIRHFTVNLDKVGYIGKYTLVGNFGYGTNGQLLSGTTTFYIVPVGAIIGALIAIAVIVLLIIFVPKMIGAYNRRIINKARK